MKYLIKKLVRHFIEKPLLAFTKLIEIKKYRKFKPNHIFTIDQGDVSFQMSFANYRLGSTIIERIKGIREPATMAILKSLVHVDQKIIEIGSCYGYFTITMASYIGGNGKIYAIEGTPNNYNILLNNISINNLTNVECYNYFVSNKQDTVEFTNEDNHPYRIINKTKSNINKCNYNNNSSNEIIEVPVICLSDFIKDKQIEPDILFMDIESFELEVLEDLHYNYFDNCIKLPILIFEMHPRFYQKPRDSEFIYSILKQHNYNYRIIINHVIDNEVILLAKSNK